MVLRTVRADRDTDPDIADIAALEPADGDMLYWATGGTRYNTTPSTSYMRGLLNTASLGVLQTALNFENGADVTDAANVAAAGALMTANLGTGVQTALGVNVGSAGSPVVNGGALGTPASGVMGNTDALTDGEFSANGLMRRTGAAAYSIVRRYADDWGCSAAANAATNQAAFLAITRGSTIDLEGNTYTVSDAAAITAHIHCFHGGLDDGRVVLMPPQRMSNPLGEGGLVIAAGIDYHWPGPAGYYAADDTIVGAYSTANRHGINLGTRVSLERACDGGIDFADGEDESSSDRDRRGIVGGMFSATRFSFVYALLDSTDVVGMAARYTDDGGVTKQDGSWTGNPIFPHGDPIFDDSGNMVVVGYGAGGLYKAVSANGIDWTSTLILATAGYPGGTALTECSIVKPNTGKFVLFARDDNGGNMRATTSADLSTWTAWVDTGLDTNGNPPAALCDWGRLWIYQVARKSQKVDGFQDALLCYGLDGDAVYAAGGALGTLPPPIVVYRGRRTLIGYLTTFALPTGRRQGYLVDGEDNQDPDEPSTSRIVALGDIVRTGARLAATPQIGRVFPLTDNSQMQHWTRGTSFTGITSRTMTADRWSFSSSTDAADVTRVEVSDAIANNLPHRPRYAMRVVSTSGGSGRQLYQRHPGRALIKAMSGKRVYAYLAVSGTWPFYVRCTATTNFGSGGSSAISDFADASQASVNTGITILRAELTIPFIDGETWGTDPYTDIVWLFNNTGAMDATIYGAWLATEDSTQLPPANIKQDRYLLDQYCEALSWGPSCLVDIVDFGSSSTGIWTVRYSPKASTPTLSIASGFDAADLLQNGSVPMTGLSFDLRGLQSARGLPVEAGAGLSTGRQEMRSSADGFGLIVDTGL